MAEWFKAAVLKTVERKFRGFESYSLRQFTERVDIEQFKIKIFEKLSKKERRGGRVGLRRTPAKCV